MKTELAGRFLRFGAASLRNFGWGCRAALLLRVDLDRVAATGMQVAAVLLLLPLLAFAVQFLQVGSDGQFTAYGLSGVWFPVVVLLLVAAAAAHRLDQRQCILPLLLLLLNAGIAIDVAMLLLQWIASHGRRWPWFAVIAAARASNYWLGLAAFAAIARLRPSLRGLCIALALGVSTTAALEYIWRPDQLWSAPYEDTVDDDYDAAVQEDVFYLQPDLLDDALQRLQPGTSGAANLYFLGVAGDARQAVFLREVHSFERLFLNRFTTSQRSLLLINNRRSLHTDPIASVTAIQAAIDRFAEVMDRDRDILFIYMTSHGSKEDGLALDFPPLGLDDLAPETLRQMLDEAGIRWRVVVVSACYSGAFVPALADDHTLVVTAAAADRTSFGCADENDFTYFGRAYFDALGATDSFVDAFDAAKKEVAKREASEHETPSHPQISVGTAIRAKLDAFVAGRDSAGLSQ